MWIWTSFLVAIFLIGCTPATPDTHAAQLNAQLGLNYLQQGDVKRARTHLAEALQYRFLEKTNALNPLQSR